MRILGIDPGIATTGYGIIEAIGNSHKVIDYGAIITKPKTPLATRLLQVYDNLNQINAKYEPEATAPQELFILNIAKTASLSMLVI